MTSDGDESGRAARERVLSLIERYGWNAMSFQVLERGFRYWFDGDNACVGYADTGRAWVVAGAPIAPPERLSEVASRFVALGRAQGRRVCYFGVEERFRARANLETLSVGEQPVWDPTGWESILRGTRSLREQLRRARARGVRVRRVDADELSDAGSETRRAVEELVAAWLASRRMAPMGFVVDVQPFDFAALRRYFVAELGGRIVGFAATVPVYARRGWFLEDLLRAEDAPNGTAELLIDAAMRAAATERSEYVTLGLAPLAGPVDGWLRVARAGARALYDFRGVHAFKAKLRPAGWDPIYLTYPRDTPAALAVYDVLAAFARGSLARFGLETALRSWIRGGRRRLPEPQMSA